MESPTWSVPFWTRTVATAPRPLSSCASMTRPLALRFGFAFSSITSAVRRIISRRLSIPSLVCAETGQKIVLPPQSSGISSYSESSCFTFSMFALGLSILLTATMISTPAAFAWLIASMVCGITPSSAATTRIAISVEFAPRIRIAVNASWPGVSRNVIFCPLMDTTDAPICWVIPPASRSVTRVERIASSRDVLPWSTWPITQTTGGRGTRFFGSSSSSFKSSAMTSIFSSGSQIKLNSSAISSAVSKSTSWFTVTISPFIKSFFTMADGCSFILSARSRIVIFSGSVIVLITFSSSFGFGCCCGFFLPPCFSRFT